MKKLIILTIFLTGCSVVTERQHKEAENLCKDRGGIAFIYGKIMTYHVEVKCGNGTTVEADILMKEIK